MSEIEPAKATATRFECVVPILRVRNLEASIDYYVRVLGFKLNWNAPGIICSVSRDGRSIMLCEGHQGNPGTWVWIGVKDIEPLYEEYRSKGARILHPPTNFQWAYEMHIGDLDGHVLRMGSEPKADQPFGDFLVSHLEV